MAESLQPFPRGWYVVAFSEEIAPKKLLVRKLAGREIVIFRTEGGDLAVVDPICPHMGAHVGIGGTVEGESIRCPFHGFRFDTKGTCVATGYGTKPPRTQMKTYRSCERHGVVLVWHDDSGCEPLWQIPDLDTRGWSPLRTHTFRLRGHPQDTTENGVDIGHLKVVHGYEYVEQLTELKVDGPSLNVRYAMTRPVTLLGRRATTVSAEFEIHTHGLGYSFVEVEVKQAGIETRNFVFATPTGEGQLELRIALSLRSLRETPTVHPLLRAVSSALPQKLAEQILLDQTFRAYRHDVAQDLDIWDNKVFVPQPALAQGDGPIARYRKWATQFYAS